MHIEGWAKPRAMLFHQRDTFRVQESSMFNGVHARAKGRFDPFGAVSMCGDSESVSMRFLNDGPHFLFAVLLSADLTFERKHTGCGHDLDHFRAVFNLVADRLEHFINSIGDAALGSLFENAGRVAGDIAMSAADADGMPRREHARTFDPALTDCIRERDISEAVPTEI